MEDGEKPLITYWAVRGRGNYVRYTMEATGMAYEEKRYTIKEADDWFGKDKPNS